MDQANRLTRIHAETTEFPLDQAVEVYDNKLKAGQIVGRAVLIPDGVQR